MITTLVSLLGRTPKRDGRYDTTRYLIDGIDTAPTDFVGWRLREHVRPQRMVVLGTAGSAWDSLFAVVADTAPTVWERCAALRASSERDVATQSQLDQLAPVLAEALGGEMLLRLVPVGMTTAEQTQLLAVLAEVVPVGAVVHLDVTHGYRSLPMLMLLSALHLRLTRGVHIGAIWYGFYNPNLPPPHPVVNLDGLLRLADWIAAIGSFRKDGDYSVFGPLLAALGLGDADVAALAEAAHAERINDPAHARAQLAAVQRRLDGCTDPMFELFRDELHDAFAWAQGGTIATRQAHMAWKYLDTGDYFRAALMAQEAAITRVCVKNGLDGSRYEVREQVRKDQLRGLHGLRDTYASLNTLRNELAHGVRPEGRDHRHEKILRQLYPGTRLARTLRDLFQRMQLARPAR